MRRIFNLRLTGAFARPKIRSIIGATSFDLVLRVENFLFGLMGARLASLC